MYACHRVASCCRHSEGAPHACLPDEMSTGNELESRRDHECLYMRRKYGVYRWGNMVKGAVDSANRLSPLARKQQPGTGIMADLDEKSELSEEQFVDLLKKIDNGLRALPATAQVGHAHTQVLSYMRAIALTDADFRTKL